MAFEVIPPALFETLSKAKAECMHSDLYHQDTATASHLASGSACKQLQRVEMCRLHNRIVSCIDTSGRIH